MIVLAWNVFGTTMWNDYDKLFSDNKWAAALEWSQVKNTKYENRKIEEWEVFFGMAIAVNQCWHDARGNK